MNGYRGEREYGDLSLEIGGMDWRDGLEMKIRVRYVYNTHSDKI